MFQEVLSRAQAADENLRVMGRTVRSWYILRVKGGGWGREVAEDGRSR